MEAFESAGEWWLPESPEDKVVGLLTYAEADGFRLKIPFGCLGDPFADICSGVDRAPLVHGYLQDGRYVTLPGCVLVGTHLHMPGTARQELVANCGLVGRGDVPDANPMVDRITLSYSRLRDWVAWHPSSSRRHEGSVDYRYETPDDVHLASGSDWKLSLCHSANLSSVSVEGFHVDHDCLLAVELESPLTVDQVEVAFVHPLWTLLSFCLDCDVGAESLKVRISDSDQWLHIGRHRPPHRTKDKVITESFMLLSMRQIGDRMQDLIGRWLSLDGDEGRAVSLLAGLITEGQAYVDLRFLAAAQALEALSRTDAREEELDADEFQRRLDLVLASITDAKVRKWARRHLEHANQRPTSDLIRDLVSDIGDYVDDIAPAKQRFLGEIRDNRNFYTHRDRRRAARVLEGEDLYVLTEGVVLVLKAAVLRRLGLAPEEVRTTMKECQGCLHWRFRVAKQYHADDGAVVLPRA